jgi:hypothetical protein
VQHPFLKTACEPREIGQMIGNLSSFSQFSASRFNVVGLSISQSELAR